MNKINGVFIAVDGPKNGGKTVVLEQVKALLAGHGVSVLMTKEPTPHFNLDNEQVVTGLGLAKLLATDRARHEAETIEPELTTHDVVITDRYIASSLVFQVLDGMSLEEVWALNRGFRLPDLNLFLMANAESLVRRRALRAAHTRLEQQDPAREIELYDQARKHMEAHGVSTALVDNSDQTSEYLTARAIAVAILSVVRGRGGRD